MALIQLNGLTKFYRMGDSIVRALDGVNMTIERGEFVAITGASGSGKSTMMHLLGCLDRPTAGTYHFDQRNVSDLSDRDLAQIRNKRIGFVFQTFNLINRTSALENVGVPLFYARSTNTSGPARVALERVGLDQRARHTPAELSGGERQRVAIARAIVNNPLLILADEPTGNLDSKTGEQIMGIFRSLNEQGVTVILVTHEQDVALQAKRVVQMRDGRIVMDRPSAEIRAEMGLAEGQDATHVKAAIFAGVEEKIDPAPAPALGRPANSDEVDTIGHALPAGVTAQARMASGAKTTLTLGIISLVLFMTGAAGFVTVGIASRGLDMTQFQAAPGTKPELSPQAIVFSLGIMAGIGSWLLSVIIGFVAVYWGRSVLTHIRTQPGIWKGRKRARTGLVMGLISALVPTGLLALKILLILMKASH